MRKEKPGRGAAKDLGKTAPGGAAEGAAQAGHASVRQARQDREGGAQERARAGAGASETAGSRGAAKGRVAEGGETAGRMADGCWADGRVDGGRMTNGGAAQERRGADGRAYVVRPARAGDLDALQGIEAASFTSAEYLDQKMSRAAMRRHIGSRSADLIVAEGVAEMGAGTGVQTGAGAGGRGGQKAGEKPKLQGTDATNRPLLGYILLFYRKGGKTARVYSVAVDPRAQGMGLGSALLEAGYAYAANKNCESVILEVASKNARLIKLYEGQGFAVTRTLPDYYGDGMHGLKMKKDL